MIEMAGSTTAAARHERDRAALGGDVRLTALWDFGNGVEGPRCVA